jgi:hypothetical protein
MIGDPPHLSGDTPDNNNDEIQVLIKVGNSPKVFKKLFKSRRAEVCQKLGQFFIWLISNNYFLSLHLS